MTKDELIGLLPDNPKADEAVFWFAFSWHRGHGSELYQILRETAFEPTFGSAPSMLADLGRQRLETLMHGRLIETRHMPVLMSTVKERDVLVSERGHLCLPYRWPCRVHSKHGALGVYCKGGWHPLELGEAGFVKGFRR